MLNKKWNRVKSLCLALGISSVLSGSAFPMTTFAAQNFSNQTTANSQSVDLLNAVASGTTKGGCNWSVDSNYALVITGGSGAILNGYDQKGWEDYKEKITSISIDVQNAKNLYALFSGYYNVKTIKAKIANIQSTGGHCDIGRMFACSKTVTEKVDGKDKTVLKTALTTADVAGMNVSNVTDMTGLFMDCANLTSVNFDNWNTGKVQYFSGLLFGCKKLKSANVSKWNTSSATYMNDIFAECTSLSSVDVSKWDTSKAVSMDGMFANCSAMKNINVANFKTGNVKDMDFMFYGCTSLQNATTGGFDTRNVQTMAYMFSYCKSLKTLDLKNFITSKTTEMSGMFEHCVNLTNINVSSFNTENVTDASFMFYDLQKIKTLDLRSFNFPKITSKDRLSCFINNCTALESFYAPRNVKVDSDFNTYRSDDRKWYRDDNNTLTTTLPKNTKTSVSVHLQEKGNKIVDVRTTGWEYKYVKSAISKGLMNGVGNTSDKAKLTIFHGNDALTRAQFVQVLYNRDKAKPNSKLKNPFKDVKKGEWYYNAVLWANNKKLVNGVKSNLFGVNDSIRRMDLVTILYKYAATKGKKYTTITKGYNIKGYADYKQVESYAVEAMTWATNHKIMNGKPITGSKKSNLDPKGKASRAECATILINFENYMSSVK